MRFVSLACFCSIASIAAAQDWNTQKGDIIFDQARMAAYVTGQTLEFYDGGKSVYGEDDTYSYVYSDGNAAPGTYEVRADGAVCTSFRHGFERCDILVERAGRVYLINEAGARFPLRPNE